MYVCRATTDIVNKMIEVVRMFSWLIVIVAHWFITILAHTHLIWQLYMNSKTWLSSSLALCFLPAGYCCLCFMMVMMTMTMMMMRIFSFKRFWHQ